MKVSEKVIKSYKKNSVKKTLVVSFPDLGHVVEYNKIYQESMGLKESLMEDENNFKIQGCVSSEFKVKIRDFGQDVAGSRIEASIFTEETEDEPVKLFTGYVKSVKMQANKQLKEIVAYDMLHGFGNEDVTEWWNSIEEGWYTIGNIRKQFLEAYSIQYIEDTLPNDNVSFYKKVKATELSKLDMLKNICQVNAVFGIVNREGQMEFRKIRGESTGGAYPGLTLWPPFYPGVEGKTPLEYNPVATYRNLSFEEFTVHPADLVVVRDSENAKQYTYGSGKNKYIVQGNIFLLSNPDEVYNNVASNIYEQIKDFFYVPYQASNNGFPFIECGVDSVAYETYDFNASQRARSGDVYEERSFQVLSRNLKGIQVLKDEYSAKGDEYQTEFLTDTNSKIENLRKESQNAQLEIEEIKEEQEKPLVIWVPNRESIGTESGVFYAIEKKG